MRRPVLSSCLAITLGVQAVGLAQTTPSGDAAEPMTPQPVTMPVVDAQPAREKAASLAKLLLDVAALPSAAVASPRELVKFEVVNGMLSAASTIRADHLTRVSYPEQRGVIVFTPQTSTASADEPVSRFSFARHDYSLPGAGMSILTVSGGDGRVIVALDAESNQKLWQVQLIQDPPPTDGVGTGEDPVRLLVRQSDLEDNKQDIDVRVSGSSFAELRRRHADAVDRYLRPIFRELGQEQLASGVDLAAAWQVLGADWKPDDETRARVASIVARLGTGDFRERERALKELTALGQPAAIVLGNADRAALRPEQVAGVDTFLSTFRPLDEADARAQADSVSFLIDCLRLDDLTVRRLAVARLQTRVGKKIEIDAAAAEPARIEAAERLRETLLPPPSTQSGL